MERENTDIWRRKERLKDQNQILQEKVETLERVEEDYGRIRNVFGEERIDRILIEVKEQEHVDEEMEKEKRKFLKRKQRDAR